jgi:hypothetical protein
VIARALRSAVLLAAAGLTVASCDTAGTGPNTSGTTTTVTAVACTNRVTTPYLSASLKTADGRAGALTVPGSMFYGTCGKAGYAVATFEPSHSATPAESVAFQDHGAYPEFFQRAGQAPWRIVGSAPGPPGVKNCATFRSLPSRLRASWGDCMATTSTTTTTLAPWCVTLMTDSFIRAQSVTIAADGTALVRGLALGVQCSPGTPDDVQFYDLVAGEAPEAVHLVVGASITGVNLSGGSMPLTLSALGHYLQQDTDGNLFQIVGPLGAATKLLGRFHP